MNKSGMRTRTLRASVRLGVLGLLAATSVSAQTPPDSVTAVAGERYRAGGVHASLFGRGYRGVWTTPFRVAVLDMATAGGGGIEPVDTGGGLQTQALYLKGADGRPYTFRGLDKNPTDVLPEEFQGSSAEDIVQDQTSSALPTAPPMVARLLDALPVLHAHPRLVVLPDDPRLGEYRSRFAGLVGTFEEWPNEGPDHTPGFAGATEVASSEELLAILEQEPEERVAITEYLAARLFDLWIGDWDRHEGQWRWARIGEGDPPMWRPIPEDRDQAFALYDGFLIGLVRQNVPVLTAFGESFPDIRGATWNGRNVDRHLLAGLSWADWDSVAQRVQTLLTDAVIDSALLELPDPHRELVGEGLRRGLVARRDQLPGMARRFYGLLSGEVALAGSDGSDRVEAERRGDGSVRVRMVCRSDVAEPVLRWDRTFLPGETKEVRIHLHAGDDTVRVVGDGPAGVRLRVVSEAGRDVVKDSNRRGKLNLYDAREESPGLSTDHGRVSHGPYEPPPSGGKLPPRDWGDNSTWYGYPSYSSDFGFVLNGTWLMHKYRFRTHPWAHEHRINADYSTLEQAFRLEYRYTNQFENDDRFQQVSLRYTGFGVVNYQGLGNALGPPGDDEFAEVQQREVRLGARRALVAWDESYVALGAFARWSFTDRSDSNYVNTERPYGSGDFGQAGLVVDFDWDRRDSETHPLSGTRILTRGAWVPDLWDVDLGAFGWLEGSATGFWSPLGFATLAGRVGARRVWGTFPFMDAAFVGGGDDVRGFDRDRFAGDASLFGNAEARLRLGRINVLLPTRFGVLGFTDAGRVWVDGESPGIWHTSGGFGIWLAPAGLANTVSGEVAFSREGKGFYFDLGFAF